MRLRFHEAADAELAEAVEYYDGKTAGLGDRLLAEVKVATRSIERYPEIAPILHEGVRGKVAGAVPVQPHVRPVHRLVESG